MDHACGVDVAQAGDGLAQAIERHRAQTVQRSAGVHAAAVVSAPSAPSAPSAATLRNGAQELIDTEPKALLLAAQGAAAEVAAKIERRQQCERDARGVCRGVDRLPQSVRSRIGAAVGVTMQVMKFSDRCVSGLEHLDEQLRRDQLEILGLDAVRERVHRIAPGPETVARTGAEFAVRSEEHTS